MNKQPASPNLIDSDGSPAVRRIGAPRDNIRDLYHRLLALHWGQMALLLRQAGVQPTDVYGPTREGWAKYGLEAPAV